jgi:small subunit ribosomal protein S2
MSVDFTLRQLMDAGVHFGHQSHRWNPRMERYIYCTRNNLHVIDLTKTVLLMREALEAVRSCVAKGGRILLVGTKRQAQKPISEAAERAAQYYVNHRWLGGMLTNWATVSNSIKHLKNMDERLKNEAALLTKKEYITLLRKRDKLEAVLGGIRDLKGPPDMLIVIDTNKESLAVKEARKLSIPVVAIVDTNSDPEGIDYPIPGNDDAARAVGLYCDLFASVVLEAMGEQLAAAGVKVGNFDAGISPDNAAGTLAADALSVKDGDTDISSGGETDSIPVTSSVLEPDVAAETVEGKDIT